MTIQIRGEAFQPDLFIRRRKKRRVTWDGPEYQLQIAVVQHLRQRATPGTVYFHVPNGEHRNKRVASKLKAMGVIPGVADLIIAVPERPVGALELKSGRNTQTKAQGAFQQVWQAAGGRYVVARGIDETLAVLMDWGAIQ